MSPVNPVWDLEAWVLEVTDEVEFRVDTAQLGPQLIVPDPNLLLFVRWRTTY